MARWQLSLITIFLARVSWTLPAPNEAGPVDYTGHRLVSVTPTTAAQVDALEHLTHRLRLDVWQHAHNVGSSTLLRLAPELAPEFMATASRAGLKVTTKCSNLQKAIENERRQMRFATYSAQDHPRFERYLNYTELKDAVQEYAKEYDHVTYATIGQSYEGRDLIAVHIKAKANLPIVFMQCGIHAREWISHATCLYIIDQLATRYEKDEEIRRLVSAYEWRIHPVVNPDGYDYTHTKDRYWRKTRSKSSASEECLGADANRNFDTREFCHTFNGSLSSPDPCLLTYCGDRAFSEVETRAIRDAVMATRNRTEFFFDLHSYGTMWMFPYGYTDAPVPEYDQLLKISRRAAEAIEKVKGSVYRVGAMYQTIYPLSGCSSDWAYDKAGVKKSFAIELQPRQAIFDADFGFLHPSKDIVSTATEAWEGVKAAVST